VGDNRKGIVDLMTSDIRGRDLILTGARAKEAGEVERRSF